MKRTKKWHKQVFVSLMGLAVFYLFNSLTLPLLSQNKVNFLGGGFEDTIFGLFSLGWGAFVLGFVLVELASFVVPPLSGWRRAGFVGRHKLNLLAVVLSLVFALAHAYLLVDFFVMATDAQNQPLLSDFGWEHQVLTFSFLIFDFLALGVLAWIMTRWGFINGFALLTLSHLLWGAFQNLFVEWGKEAPDWAGLVMLTLLMVLVVKVLHHPSQAAIECKDRQFPYELQSLPQGIMPLFWTATLLVIPSYWILEAPERIISFGPGKSWSYAFSFLGLCLVGSLLSYQITYSPWRIRNQLGDAAELKPSFAPLSKFSFLYRAVFLSLAAFLWVAPSPFFDGDRLLPEIIKLEGFLLVLFICKDLRATWLFAQSNEDWVSLGDFDNVPLMAAAQGLLDKEGIAHHVKGFYLRSLYSFFNPLYKMSLLVKAEDLDRAQFLLEPETTPTV